MGNRSQELHASPVGEQRGGIWVWHQNHAAATRSRATSRSSLISLFWFRGAENSSHWWASWKRTFRGHGDERHRSALKDDMQTRVLPDSEQVFGTTGMVGWQTGAWGGRSRGVRSRMDDICYTMFQVPMETRSDTPNPLPVPSPLVQLTLTTHARHGGRQTRAAGGAQQLCCTSPLLLFDFLPSTSAG